MYFCLGYTAIGQRSPTAEPPEAKKKKKLDWRRCRYCFELATRADMKPPPRKRNKPDRSLNSESARQQSGNLVSKWQKTEQRKLLSGLKRLHRTGDRNGENEYAFLRKCVPTRSVVEVRSVSSRVYIK